MSYKEKYNQYLDFFNLELQRALNSINNSPSILKEAMEYAIMCGGKRVRPILLISTAEMLGVNLEEVKELAVALECIHTYSLVHDDLPAMDNDDYRRGKLSTHKKFGEAYGILCGDALLNFAFEHCLSKPKFSKKEMEALLYLSKASGCLGMIAGQILDLQNEKNKSPNEEVLYSIYENKTAKLIMAPIMIACILSGKKHYEKLEEFAYNLGIMFQISDDILDVEGSLATIGKTPHKDEITDKLTSIKVFGLEKAKEMKQYHYNKCVNALNDIDNNEFLLDFVKNIYLRSN